MRKLILVVAVMCASVLGTALHANFTLFDMAKDAMFIARGEFTGLERTARGDRLTLSCEYMIKGAMPAGGQVTLEAFEPAPADAALGRDAIVAFNSSQGVYYFLHHPFSQRGAFYFESDDKAPDGLEQSERALRNFMAINEPHTEAIRIELTKRWERKDLSFEGEFEPVLVGLWKEELLRQCAWHGTWAARDAAKALFDHDIFKGAVTPEDEIRVGELAPASEVGSIGRSYMLAIVRRNRAAHPAPTRMFAMVREETSQACVGKLAWLLADVEDRSKVLSEMGALITDPSSTEQMRINGLQVLQGIKDVAGLPHVHAAIRAEMARGMDASKPVLRRAFDAMKALPSPESIGLLDEFIATEFCTSSWEMTQYAWVAFSMIDTAETNQRITDKLRVESNLGKRKFFNKLVPENKVYRELLIIHPES